MKIFLSLWIVALSLILSIHATIPTTTYPKTYQYEYTPQYRSAVCDPDLEIQTPENEEELLNIVRFAILLNTTVKAFGSRHSATDIICTEGVPIDMRNINHIQYNEGNKTVTVGAGRYLRDVGPYLHTYKRAFKMTPAYGGITIGGAVGTGAHGSSLKWKASISDHVVGMRIIDGMGQIRYITDTEELKAFRVHLGLLGVVVDVTLETYDEFKLKVHNYVTSDEILYNGTALQLLNSGDSVFFYWYPSQSSVVVSYGTVVNATEPGNCYSNDHVPSTSPTFKVVANAALEAAAFGDNQAMMALIEAYFKNTLFTTVVDFVPIYTENNLLLKNPGVGYSHNMLAADCNTPRLGTPFNGCPWEDPNPIKFVDQEISMDLANMSAFVQDVKIIMKEYFVTFPLQGILLRFSKSQDTIMATSNGRDSCHFEWYMAKPENEYQNPPAGMPGYQTMMQLFADKYNGRSHWGKTGLFYHTTAMLIKKLAPNHDQKIAAFEKVMNKYDPNGVFANNFRRRLFNASYFAMDSDPLTVHCALLDDCICSQDTDCAAEQTCTNLPGYTYRICRNKSQSSYTPIDLTSLPDDVTKNMTKILNIIKQSVAPPQNTSPLPIKLPVV